MEAEVLVKTVCPSPEELSVIVNSVQCLECGLIFQNEPRLRMHDLKIHKQENLVKSEKKNIQYHCPVASCVYALKSKRYFSTMKYLKQVSHSSPSIYPHNNNIHQKTKNIQSILYFTALPKGSRG